MVKVLGQVTGTQPGRPFEVMTLVRGCLVWLDHAYNDVLNIVGAEQGFVQGMDG